MIESRARQEKRHKTAKTQKDRERIPPQKLAL